MGEAMFCHHCRRTAEGALYAHQGVDGRAVPQDVLRSVHQKSVRFFSLLKERTPWTEAQVFFIGIPI
jgi:hypothetical protein